MDEHAVYLLRHGQTEWSATGKHTSHTDIPLTAEGAEAARKVGALLGRLAPEPALVLTSPRQRARRTAELAGLAIDEVLDDLVEWDYGDYEGLTTPEIRETVPGWTVWTHPCPNGETPEQVAARAERVVRRAREAREKGDVVLVGHGHFGRVLVATWIGQPPAFGVHFALEAAGVTVLGDERGVPQIEALNLSAAV